uniref:Uncharacterized protein n=1 Tax=Sphaerodactylus townsendi TaxID=933632 RepID=A0ACB8FYJ6_9SAUR
MAKALMLFLFLTFFRGCDAQFTMTQPPSVSAAIGETVKISCRRSSGRIDDYDNSWYQQKPGSAPKLLIDADDLTASGISDRFSGSLDSSANAAILTISSVQIEDEADYYCLSYDSSLQYTMIQPHGEVRQKPPCSRSTLHRLYLAGTPAEPPVTSQVNESQEKVQVTEGPKEWSSGSLEVDGRRTELQGAGGGEAGCDAQFTMTQPPSVSAAIGETVKISCRRSSESIDDYWNSWYQQKPSSAPKLLIYRNDDRESGISDRFSGSLDSSANAAILTISSVQIDDEADYYCLSYDSSLQYTMIQLHGEVRQKPPCSDLISFVSIVNSYWYTS